MRFCFLVLFFFTISCTGDKSKNLELYREKALRYLVQERIQKNISSAEFKKLSIWSLPGWHLMLFQGDNVDRSQAFFQLEEEAEQTQCGLYIREAPPNDLAINLIQCQGPYSFELSGDKGHGLGNLTVPK